MLLYLNTEIQSFFTENASAFDELMQLSGDCFRHQKGRTTKRLLLGGKSYFIKQHQGVGWKEIFKNLIQARLPIISAKNEWLAIKRLQVLEVAAPKVVAYGERGKNPATRQSFILMEELAPVISLEDLGKTWQTKPPSFMFKQALLKKVAQIAKCMHENGINHRDFYLCHFLLDLDERAEIKLYLIDLHRASIRHLTPKRWLIKDLAGLYFSSKEFGLTQRDLLRFIHFYRAKPLREIVAREKNFWQKVKVRGEQLYRDHTK